MIMSINKKTQNLQNQADTDFIMCIKIKKKEMLTHLKIHLGELLKTVCWE